MKFQENICFKIEKNINQTIWNQSRRVVVFVIRYAIRSAKSGNPAVGQSFNRLVQR